MITDLKAHHFSVGKQSIPVIRSNETYGAGVTGADKPGKAPWAHLNTNFELGRDKPSTMNKTMDSKFHTRAASQGNPFEECRRNKAKIEGDDIKIAGNSFRHGQVSSHMAYPDVFSASKNINKGLDPHMSGNIKGSHFKTGYNNNFSSVTESKGNMIGSPGINQNRLSPERIDFFKGTHHQIGNPNLGFMAEPTNKSTFVNHDVKKQNLNANNNAFNLRHKVHDHGQIGKQASGFVTESQMRQKWI